jgi:hypothetical protein
MDNTTPGVFVPEYVTRETVAGANATIPPFPPGSPAGAIDPTSGTASYSRKKISRVDIDLSVAQANPQRFSYSGTAIWCVGGSSDLALVQCFLDNLENDALPVSPGFFLSGVPFKEVYLTWQAQAGVSINLAFFTDAPDDRVSIK